MGHFSSDDKVSEDQKLAQKKLGKRATSKKKRNRGRPNVAKHQNEAFDDINTSQKNEPLEEPEKQAMRTKKNRSNSPTSSALTDTCNRQNKTVFYEPLPLFIQLKLEPPELYSRFLPYVLLEEQLVENNFPLDCPNNPGRASFGTCPKFKLLDDNNNRWCCRCGEKFTISDDGLYESESTCCYHSGKRLSIGGVSGAGPYTCCGNYSTPDGCTRSKHHVSAYTSLDNVKFVKTRDKREIQPFCRIYALDCEMCYTVQGLEVTRISIVGTDGLTVYDSYVLPENTIIDYNTAYSGITQNHLKDVKTTLADVQAFLLKLLSSKTVLVGHGLENDLRALRLIHETVVDTSVAFPHHHGYPYKRSLKSITSSILKRTIHEGSNGHDSVEDARTCIELMLWKIQADSQKYARSQQRLQVKADFIPRVQKSAQSEQVFPLPIPPTTQWQSSFNYYSTIIPYNVGLWVPPVGASCELY